MSGVALERGNVGKALAAGGELTREVGADARGGRGEDGSGLR